MLSFPPWESLCLLPEYRRFYATEWSLVARCLTNLQHAAGGSSLSSAL